MVEALAIAVALLVGLWVSLLARRIRECHRDRRDDELMRRVERGEAWNWPPRYWR